MRPLGIVAVFGAVLGAIGHYMHQGPKVPPEEA
jgi:hypothetical protein